MDFFLSVGSILLFMVKISTKFAKYEKIYKIGSQSKRKNVYLAQFIIADVIFNHIN